MIIVLNDVINVGYNGKSAIIKNSAGDIYVAYDPDRKALGKKNVTLKLTLTKANKPCLYVSTTERREICSQ